MATPSYRETTLSCPICNSHAACDYSVVGYGSQPPGGVRDFAVLRCLRHGVEFADAIPPARDSNAAKESLYCLYGDPAASSHRYVEFMNRVEAIVGPANGRILHDVGCGTGSLLFEARRREWRVQGSDIVPGVKHGIEENGIPCLIGSLADLSIPDELCDVVTSFCVLPHHLTEPTADMLTVARILKPGGWFVLQFPDNGSFRKVGKMLSRLLGSSTLSRSIMANLYGPGGHQFAFTRTNLEEYLSACGFKGTIFQSYSASPKYALARFHDKPLWYRVAASFAVYGLKITSEGLGMPNHSIAFTRK